MPRFSTIFACFLALAACLAVAAACNKGDGREEFGGDGLKASQGGTEAGGDEAGETEAGSTDIGATDGSSNEPLDATSKTLEQCTAEKKAWIAVVNSGASPSVCGDALVDYCCTQPEIVARFPSKKTDLEAKFAELIDAEKYVLYHCSSSAADKKSTFHMAKFENGSTFYKTVFVTGLIPASEGTGVTDCPTPTTDDLQVEGATEGAATLDFTADIVPILAASCAGAACHDAANTAGAPEFDGTEAAFKAVSKTKIENDEMPPPPATLPAEDKAKLLDFLAQ